nr:ABC transporter substrate-binding protein [Rhodoferax sp.]
MKTLTTALLSFAICGAVCGSNCEAGEVEVLHFWTSPGEAKSLVELKALLAARRHVWKDFAVVGGGGQNAMTALRQRLLAGNPPASATIKGPAIQEMAALNVFADLDVMARFDHWDEGIPKVVQQQVKYKGHYVAVPVNIHRVNWLWSNSEVLTKSGVVSVPTSFDAFMVAADKIKAAGFVPLAHGGQPWQDFVLFESVVLGVGGADFFKRAFVDLDPYALSSPEMKKVLETFRRLKPYTDDKSRGRDWNVATDMVIKGKAAFQFMGDWAKGEFLVAGQRPGHEFNCTPSPGSASAFSYVVDTFTMFQLKGWEAQKAQGYLAYVLLGDEFQEKFSQRKGSIPVRMNVSVEKFDDCGQSSRRDFISSEKSNELVPSVAVDMAVATWTQAALRAVVSDFWNIEALSVNEAMNKLVLAAASPRPK